MVSNDILKQRRKIKEAQNKLKHKREHKDSNDTISCEFEEKERLVAQQFEEQRKKEKSFFSEKQEEVKTTENEIEEEIETTEEEQYSTAAIKEKLDDIKENSIKSKKQILREKSEQRISELKRDTTNAIAHVKERLKEDLEEANTDSIEEYATLAQEEIEELEETLEETLEEIDEELDEQLEEIDDEEYEDDSSSSSSTSSSYSSDTYSSGISLSFIPKLAFSLIIFGVIFMVGFTVLNQLKATLPTATETAGMNVSTNILSILNSSSPFTYFIFIIPFIFIGILIIKAFTPRHGYL